MRKRPSNTIYDFGLRSIEDRAAYMRAYMAAVYNAKKITCCDITFAKGALSKHLRSKRHQRNELKKQIE